MDAGRSGTRQSDFSSARDQEHLESRPRAPLDGPYRNGPAMATATLLSPTAPHHPHQAYSPGYSPTSIASMLSPTESRRTSDEAEAPHRQSLPSIRDVISNTKPGSYTAPPATSAPSLPSPFATSAPPRPFSDVSSEKHVSPRTLQHPPSSFPPRSEPMPAFSHPARPAMSGRPPAPPPPPPMPAYQAQHPSPPRAMEHTEPRRMEAQPYNGGYPHQPHQQQQQPPPPPPASGHYPAPGQLPPGQLPMPDFPPSPRQAGQLPSPFDAQRPPMYSEERGTKYEATLNRALVAWSYGDTLNRVSGSAQAIYHFAEAFNAAAREQHGAQPIPSRLPTEEEVNDMLDNAYMIKKCLDEMRGMVQQSRMNNERARETNVVRKNFEEDETMYSEAVKAPYGMGNDSVKRRRGRAAPPGRCHSCNRIDTPEWRRGPDGARTLCNACGLHYAKLERKRQLEQRNIRPKPQDERS